MRPKLVWNAKGQKRDGCVIWKYTDGKDWNHRRAKDRQREDIHKH
jgi:hypothetical protein